MQVWCFTYTHLLIFYYDFFSSTVSSGLNSLAAVVLEDFMKPFWAYRKRELTEMQATFYSKLLGKFVRGFVNGTGQFRNCHKMMICHAFKDEVKYHIFLF